MSNSSPDWSKFTRRIFIARPIETVYSAWATPAQLMQWFLEEARYLTLEKQKRDDSQPIQAGDRYTWKWNNWDFEETGKVMEANGKDYIRFSFGSAGVVHLHFTEYDDGTMMKLIQEAIPMDDKSRMNYYVGCSSGWTFWLTNLKAWLEHGITLNAYGLNQDETKDLVNS